MGYGGCHFLVVKLNAWSVAHLQEQVVQYRLNHIVPDVGILFFEDTKMTPEECSLYARPLGGVVQAWGPKEGV